MITIEKQNISAFEYREMRDWCKNTVGTESWYFNQMHNGKWYSYSACDHLTPGKLMQWRGSATFVFSEQKDCLFFGIKWA